MKKGNAATMVLALVIGLMVVFVSKQLCNWMPVFSSTCWAQEKLHESNEVLLVHHGQMNRWHERTEHDFGAPLHATRTPVKSECEIGKTAVLALGHSSEEEALVTLESLALSASCLEVRKAAVHAIEGYGSEKARASLIRILMATAG